MVIIEQRIAYWKGVQGEAVKLKDNLWTCNKIAALITELELIRTLLMGTQVAEEGELSS